MSIKDTNIAYYLKYRPQYLNDLVGQEIVKKTLHSAFQSNKLSHAYLLTGPRGTGKTSTARILAKMVNCEKSSVVSRQSSDKTSLKADSEASLKTDSYIPCNQCSTCLSITDGSNLDLIEIDAASNRGIDDIRSLREKVKLSPTSAKKKVYIIDEVHMLTTEAFNALLKTLEEPPFHALFILATTDVGKIPQTILSRVQRLDFKLATPAELLEVLKVIVKREKIDIDDMALKFLAKKAGGSFRDGVKFLDQVSSIEGKITTDVLEKFLKASNVEILLELIEVFVKLDTTKGLTIITKEVEEGVDIKELILSLMDVLRNLVFIKNELGERLVKENYSEENYQSLVKVSESFSNQDLINRLEILQKALEKMKTTSIPSLPLELAVVEMTQSVILSDSDVKSEESKDPLLVSLSRSGRMQDSNQPPMASLARLASKRASGGLRDSSPAPESVRDQNDKVEKSDSDTSDLSVIRHTDTPTSPTSLESSDSSDILKIKEKWTYVCETIRPYNFSLEALLRSTNITECNDTTVVMEVPYSFHQRILEAPKNREILESVLSDVLGRSIKVLTVLGNRPVRGEDVANIEVAQDDEIIRAAAEIFNSDSVN